jgi:hypothetical protein
MRIIRVLVVVLTIAVAIVAIFRQEPTREERIVPISSVFVAGPSPGSRLVEYRGIIPGYWVSIIENLSGGEVCHLAVSLCPLEKGRDCVHEEISQTMQSRDSDWDTALCGIDPCPDQKQAHELVQIAVDQIFNSAHIAKNVIEDAL